MDGFVPDPDRFLAEHGEVETFSAAPRPGLRVLSLADCAAAPSRGYIVKGLLAPGDVALLFGAPGSGKSVLAPYIAHAVAQGREVFDRRVRRTRVLYAAMEDGHGMTVRFAALRRQLGDTPDLLLIPDALDLQRPEMRGLLIEEARKHRAGVIVLDTVARAFPGLRENDPDAMGEVVATLRELADDRRAVLALHHAPKNGDTPRGHGVLNGDADLTIRLEKTGQVIGGTLGKNRNGPCEANLAIVIRSVTLGMDEDGDPITAPVAEEAELPCGASRARLTPEERGWLKDIQDLFAEPGEAQQVTISPNTPPVLAVLREKVRERLQQRGRIGVAAPAATGRGARVALSTTDRSLLSRHLKRFKELRKLDSSKEWVWLP